jgi:lysophospholipase L1-like esterase
MRKALELIFFNVALVCVLLVGMELVGQVVFYLWKGYPVFRPRPAAEEGVLELHPYLVGRPRQGIRVEDKGKVVTTTSLHTRWTGAPTNPSAVRVAVVGGSTTFGAGVTDTDSWPVRLQTILGPEYAVMNFGMLGYSTAEAIIQMALLVPEVRPDIVVFYEGWNDIRSYHDSVPSPDYYSHGMRQYTTLQLKPPARQTLRERMVDISALWRLTMVVSKPAQTEQQAVQGRSYGPAYATPDTFVDRIYRRNLETLKLLTERSGAYAIFVPQILNDAWYAQHSGGDWWTPHVDDHAMPALIRRFGLTMDAICGPREPHCGVLGAVRDWKWQPDDFIDEGHFSGKGGEAFARLLAPRIAAYASEHHLLHTAASGP